MKGNSTLKNKILEIAEKKNLSIYRISKLMDVNDSALYGMVTGDTAFSPKFIKKISPIIEVSENEIRAWILVDKYPKKVIEIAIQEIKKRENKEIILTKNIDKILQSKSMSRTKLSKIINYSQSGLNRIILGRDSMSKDVISKIAPVLEVSEDTIKGWIIADKYSLKLLELTMAVQV